MTKLFFHHVGKQGAQRDFPKTVYSKVNIDQIRRNSKDTTLLTALETSFPEGRFNVWGVPANALTSNPLEVGDFVLLIGHVYQLENRTFDGDFEVLGEVKVCIPTLFYNLSIALWGESRFPYLFFFDAETINLKWSDFRQLLGYQDRYRPQGMLSSVRDDRLAHVGGVQGFVEAIRKTYQ